MKLPTFTLLLPLCFAAPFIAAPGCKKEPDPYAAQVASAEKKLEAKEALGEDAPKQVEGKKLNAFFPEKLLEAERTFTTEKDGYVEAKYAKEGAELFTLTIADISDNADSKVKFTKSTERASQFPVATFGKKQTMALVQDRYQVKIISDTLAHEQRKALLEQLDLNGIAAL